MRKLKPWQINPETIYEDILASDRWVSPREAALRSAATKRKNGAAKRAAALDKAVERMEATNRAKPRRNAPAGSETIAARMLRGMEPGQWYGLGDIPKLAGAAREAKGKVYQVLRKARFVERAPNPAYDPLKVIFDAGREPQWLWRLTEAGEAERQRLLGALGSVPPR